MCASRLQCTRVHARQVDGHTAVERERPVYPADASDAGVRVDDALRHFTELVMMFPAFFVAAILLVALIDPNCATRSVPT